ncbi:hypothetical protein KEM52_006626, partial [Ascosphaera acerosa]
QPVASPLSNPPAIPAAINPPSRAGAAELRGFLRHSLRSSLSDTAIDASPTPSPQGPGANTGAASSSSHGSATAVGAAASSPVAHAGANGRPGHWLPVLARVSSNVVRLEREFHMLSSYIKYSDPECRYTIRPIDIIRLAPQPGDNHPLIATLYEYYGDNSLRYLVPFGPADFRLLGRRKMHSVTAPDTRTSFVSLDAFFAFAIGACECLEKLHSCLKAIHGEIRADAFHFNADTGQVRLFQSGNGARSFDNALGEGWITLSRELGVENKLQFIAPEQTGRLPIEPDTRTDIYALGVLFYSMLAGHPAFNGTDPVEIMQNVLSQKLLPLSFKRQDVPEALSAVVQKMIQKQMDDRYHTISSVKQDLQNIRALVEKGDVDGLRKFVIGEGDVSSFFTLPAEMVGRREQFDRVLSVVHRAHKRLLASITANQESMPALFPVTPGLVTPTSEGRFCSADVHDSSTDSESNDNVQLNGRGDVAGNLDCAAGVLSSETSSKSSPGKPTPAASHPAAHKPSLPGQPEGLQLSGLTRLAARPQSSFAESISVFERKKAHTKYRHGGRCEVITIYGPSGVGKTDFLTRLQPEIRKQGYACIARLDRGRREPFGPLIKVMASLLRQIFTERDITTSYHAAIRAVLQPTWSTLHAALDLPEQLIYPAGIGPIMSLRKSSQISVVKESESGSPPPTPMILSTSLGQTGAATDTEEKRPLPAAKLVRFADTFVDMLRALSLSKLFCLCIDDVQNADAETTSILKRIVDTNVRCVLVVTSGREEMLSDSLKTLFHCPDETIATNITLGPLNDEEMLDYVATTLHQPARQSLTPLASLIGAMSRGIPFYVRLILESCYRSECIYYNWEECKWQYDIDRILQECPAPERPISKDFISKAFGDLRSEGRSILLWASMLGSPFSFSFVVKLLSGQFLEVVNGSKDDLASDGRTRLVQPQIDVVTAGLQYLLQCGVIIPGETDDEFAHDHYSRALSLMTSQEMREKMHCVIAMTIMSSTPLHTSIYSCARHISLAAPLIRATVPHRSLYRQALHAAAQTASQSEAKPTALEYLDTCLMLLPEDPWDCGEDDVRYEEARDLYIETAELCENLGQSDRALLILDLIFPRLRSPICKIRPWTLKAKILFEKDDMIQAQKMLFDALEELGVKVHLERTWAECDQLWSNLSAYLRKTNLTTLFGRPLSEDPQVKAIGTILRSALSCSTYYNPKTYLVLTIEMMNQFIFGGAFVQAAFACLCAATVALGRYKDVDLAMKMGEMLVYCKDQYDDPWAGRIGMALYSSFVDDIRRPIIEMLPSLEASLEAAYMLGGSGSAAILLNTLCLAHSRLCLGHDMAELDTILTLIPGVSERMLGHQKCMVFFVTFRQLARALQGKTHTDDPVQILSDENHDSVAYLKALQNDGQFSQSVCIYQAAKIVSLYAYGYYTEAIGIAEALIGNVSFVFIVRMAVMAHFYYALTLLHYHLDNPGQPKFEQHMEAVRRCQEVVDFHRNSCDENYGMWSLTLEALQHETAGDHAAAVQSLELALRHCQNNGFAVEEALVLELQAYLQMRTGATSAAQALVHRAISSWNRIGSSGKAKQLYEKHRLLLDVNPLFKTRDVGCQTVDSLLNHPTRVTSQAMETIPLSRQVGESQVGLQDGDSDDDDDAEEEDYGISRKNSSPVELDVIDHYNILEVSQIISSQLEIGKLLPKMVKIILESCSGSELAVVITEHGQDNWCVSASADHETGVRTFKDGAETGEFDSKIAVNITHYTLRTREQVLVSNVLEDDRFLNVSPTYATTYPEGKSIIALPIVQADKLLGAIQIEGKPQTFTQRNFTVLRLICNQIGISLANAFLFAEANKISAANANMVEAQRLALTHAREAEQKAKLAEAKARRSVKLKEDAAKAKSIFLANISHDLRTPMNGVIGLSELLKKTQLDRQQDGYVESIRVCADTLLTLINDILDFSKLEAGKMKISAVPINLKGCIAEVVRALRYTHRDRNLETIDDLEGIDPDLVVVSDPVRLHQIFMNLLSNSYKFTQKGSITVRANAQDTEDGRVHVTCAVADTGIGIGQEQMARLFKPFSQADSSTERSYGGSGLGLSICKAIIESVLGGKINLQSEPGLGTTVTFELTFDKAIVGTEAQISYVKELTPSSRPLSSSGIKDELRSIPRDEIRVCIAEDNPINQKIAVTFIRHFGLKSEAFNNGREAVEALRRRSKEGQPFHLVLMDVQMPVLDGYNATRLIREDEDPNVHDVLVIAMTASAIDGDREKCIDAGMNNYLAKPVRSDVLKAMLDTYLAPAERDQLRHHRARRPASMPPSGPGALRPDLQRLSNGDTGSHSSLSAPDAIPRPGSQGGEHHHQPLSSRKSLSNGEAMELFHIAHAKKRMERQDSDRQSTGSHSDDDGLEFACQDSDDFEPLRAVSRTSSDTTHGLEFATT